MQFFLLIEVELLQYFPFQIAIGHSRCSHVTHKNPLYEGYEYQNRHRRCFAQRQRRSSRSWRKENFLYLELHKRESYTEPRVFHEQIAFTQFARSRNAQRRKDINIRISVIEIGILRARLDIDGTAM